MKKLKITVCGIAMMASMLWAYSCSKDGNALQDVATGSESVAASAKGAMFCTVDFFPHFKFSYLKSHLAPCVAPSGYFCGVDASVSLTGDEICWLMCRDNDPYALIFPTVFLEKNKVDELIDSARNGSVTFYDDCNLDPKLVEQTGFSSIPAGRYPAKMDMHKEDSAVFINLRTKL